MTKYTLLLNTVREWYEKADYKITAVEAYARVIMFIEALEKEGMQAIAVKEAQEALAKRMGETNE